MRSCLDAAVMCALLAHCEASARAGRQCTSALDCSLNGDCTSGGACACSAPWKGASCGELDLLPAPPARGYASPAGDSWGGSVSFADGAWHLWAAEVDGANCSLEAYKTNCAAVHAVAAAPGGPYARADEALPAEACGPVVVPVGDQYYMFHIGNASGGAVALTAEAAARRTRRCTSLRRPRGRGRRCCRRRRRSATAPLRRCTPTALCTSCASRPRACSRRSRWRVRGCCSATLCPSSPAFPGSTKTRFCTGTPTSAGISSFMSSREPSSRLAATQPSRGITSPPTAACGTPRLCSRTGRRSRSPAAVNRCACRRASARGLCSTPPRARRRTSSQRLASWRTAARRRASTASTTAACSPTFRRCA